MTRSKIHRYPSLLPPQRTPLFQTRLYPQAIKAMYFMQLMLLSCQVV